MISKGIFGLPGILVACFGALTAGAAAAMPAASDWSRNDQTQVRLVSAATATGNAETLRLGLQFVLQPGWKIYWRSPGDAGLPPRPVWSGSRNLEAVAVHWPAPERFELFGLDTFGYGDEVVLPIDVRLERPGAPLALKLGLDYLICEKICIPYEAALALDLPAGAASPSDHAQLIDRFFARVPRDGAGAGLAVERAAWNAGGTPVITVTARALAPFQSPDVYVEGPTGGAWSGVSFGRPEASYAEEGRRAVLRIPVRAERTALADTAAFVGAPVTLTLVDGPRAMEATLTLEAGLPTPDPVTIGFVAVLGAALIGGLILNLMPCVLPVLSLKLLGFVGHGGASRQRVRRNFLASAAGIVTAFIVLALSLIGLKAAGATIGWGIQFQQPVFLVVITLVLTLFAANLWGWFEIRLPGAIAAVAVSESPKPLHEETAWGAFLTGAFAMLLATPCSAPFVGTAVGFALARGPLEILAVFAALGLGLALPYLLVAAVPGLASRLPRPGQWMVRLRAILGVAAAATAVWLLSVLAAQIDGIGVHLLMATLLAILTVLWWMRAAEDSRRWRARAAVAALAVFALLMPLRFTAPPVAEDTAPIAGKWRQFDLETVETLVGNGQVVFVDVTADWCITCQVNKTAVMTRGEVAARLADGSVSPLRADWTRPDPAIARYLASFGRYGIPFNVVYGPGAPAGIVLPEILTADAVLNAFVRAKAPTAGRL